MPAVNIISLVSEELQKLHLRNSFTAFDLKDHEYLIQMVLN